MKPDFDAVVAIAVRVSSVFRFILCPPRLYLLSVSGGNHAIHVPLVSVVALAQRLGAASSTKRRTPGSASTATLGTAKRRDVFLHRHQRLVAGKSLRWRARGTAKGFTGIRPCTANTSILRRADV